MNNIEIKIKKWIELIQTEKLNDVTEDIQANEIVPNGRINKHIFKLLLYLSHTADKCDKQNHVIGKDIYNLTNSLCSILIEIPDSIKFISSLFHIIRCLLTMHMYDEAYKVCFYLKTEALHYSHENVSDLLVKIAYLWYNVINNEFLVLQKDTSGYKHYQQLKCLIKYELKVIKIAYKNYTKQLLMKISSYLDKIALIKKKPNCFPDFSMFIVQYLSHTKILLNNEEKSTIYGHMLQIMSRITCENMTEGNLMSSTNILNSITKLFKKSLSEDEESYQGFLLFEDLCQTLVKPVENLTDSSIKSMKRLNKNYIQYTRKYENTKCMKWTVYSIIQIFEHLFVYWDMCIKTGKKIYLKNDLLLETLNLVGHLSTCFRKQSPGTCKSCERENCTIKKDIYNAVVISTRCINLISKFSTDDLSKDTFALVRTFLEQNMSYIYEIKEWNCKSFTLLWCSCSALLYNFGIMSDCYYEESISLFSLLFSSIIQIEGIQSQSRYINLDNPISFTLHRISSLHYNNGMYREAMTAAALNALLSYKDPESKAFRMWANIKHKSVSSKEIIGMTILTCLKNDKSKMEELGISIDLSKYDLVQICLREAKGLQEAKVNLSAAIRKVLHDMKTLKATPVQHAQVVQLLAYHSLHFNTDQDNLEYLEQAISNLRQVKPTSSVLCLQANLEFYTFVNQLHTMNKKTQAEMECAKFALHAPRIDEIEETESRDVVPAYTMINIKEDSKLMTCLQVPVKKWGKCFKHNISEIAQECEPKITLHTLVIAGEYAHLYRYQECEVNIWKYVYALASELKNNSAIIYGIARSVALRYINRDWITTANELANKFKDTDNEETIYSIAIFWISLSDFYFECGRCDEARKLLDDSRMLPGVSFFSNIAVYLYSLDRILYNCHLYKETIEHKEYTRFIVETLYTMVNLNEELSARRWEQQDKHLFGLDILLSTAANLSLRMNSLLSFREIGAHLIRSLRTAQSLGATIRVAEILKFLCYIDLSRAQLSDCEIKLQGLEHILNIETFKMSMNSKPAKMCTEMNVMITPIKAIEPIRDVPQNDTSPVLRNKVFDLPEFMCHANCSCYMCQNVSYHYLVLASTHIRAQLYALQRNVTASLQHFHGAFKIKERLRIAEKSVSTEKCKEEYLSCQERFYTVDYVLLLVNFSYFLRSYLNARQDKILAVILLAARMCDMYKLKGHPIHMAVMELMLDYRFQKIYDASDHSDFTVPDASEINIKKYTKETKVEGSICVTPITNNTRVKKLTTLKRNRTPPVLKLTKVSMNFSDDEDIPPSPPSLQYKRTSSRNTRLTKRKIMDDEYLDNNNAEQSETAKAKTSLLLKNLSKNKEEDLNDYSINDIIVKVASLSPGISEHLCKIIDKLDEPATTKNVQKLIETVENLKVNSASLKNIRRTRHSKHLTSSDYNKINEVIALFKGFDVNEKNDNCDTSNKIDAFTEHNKKESMPAVKKDAILFQKQNSRGGDVDDAEKFEHNTLSINQFNNVDNVKKTSESTRITRITRNSTKHSAINKESNNLKIKKSKEKLV